MQNPGIIMHDGNFGADWVNITRGPQLIAKVPYLPGGLQRDIARRVVWAWNNIDTAAQPSSEALAEVMRRRGKSVWPAQVLAMTLAERLRNVRERIEPGMPPEAVAQLLVDINHTLQMVK